MRRRRRRKGGGGGVLGGAGEEQEKEKGEEIEKETTAGVVMQLKCVEFVGDVSHDAAQVLTWIAGAVSSRAHT
jgi:hypothetical protein